MIRTVILGADTPDAGELIRILAMHPEVEIVSAHARDLEGRPLTSIHHGLIGETDLAFSSLPRCSKCDIIFDFSENGEPALRKELEAQFPEAKMIALGRAISGDEPLENMKWTYGLPEINRKALVRGAQRAVVPSPFASAALVALYPLALNLLLNSDLHITVSAPDTIIKAYDAEAVAHEIQETLEEAQLSFSRNVAINPEESASRRTALLSLDLPCRIDMGHLLGMYDMYKDHHFAFAVNGQIGFSEVAGTDKCVVSLMRSDPSMIRVQAVADCRMRGGAGEAVHIMNLMFGLHERTGLALKAIDFHPV